MIRTATTLDRVTELDRLDLPSLTGATIEISEPIRFGDDAESDLRNLARLRDVTSHAVRLIWSLDGSPRLNIRQYSHLIPPSSSASRECAQIAANWRGNFRYGTFYYRIGPNFVSIKDVRPGGDHARMTVSGTDAERFLRLASQLPRVNNVQLGVALDVMVQAGLALCTETSVLVLPFRIRHWPVPFIAI